jgi:hypothetical protein
MNGGALAAIKASVRRGINDACKHSLWQAQRKLAPNRRQRRDQRPD